MAELGTDCGKDNLNENASSEEWTIISKKSIKDSDSSKEKIETKDVVDCNKKPITESRKTKDKPHQMSNKDINSVPNGDMTVIKKYIDKDVTMMEKSNGKYCLNMYIAEFLFFISITLIIGFGVGMYMGIIHQKNEMLTKNSEYKAMYDSYEKIKAFTENLDKFHQMAGSMDNLQATWPNIRHHVNNLSKYVNNFMNDVKNIEKSVPKVEI